MDLVFLSNLSVLKSFNDEGKDVFDSLLPFAEYVLYHTENEYIDLESLKEQIHEKCGLSIPSRTLITLLKRLKKDNKIEQFDRFQKIKILEKDRYSELEYQRKISESTRQINKFVLEYKVFSKSDMKDEDILNDFLIFMDKYKGFVDLENDSLKIVKVEENEKILVDFIERIMTSEPDLYETFRFMFYGYILSKFIENNTPVENRNLSSIKVYIDSNFVLRILDFQSPDFSKASTELLQLMIQLKMKTYVFEASLDEVRFVIKKSLNDYKKDMKLIVDMYGEGVSKLDGVIGSFFRRKMKLTDIQDYIENLESKLKSIGVTTDKYQINEKINYNSKQYTEILRRKMDRLTIKEDKDDSYFEYHLEERTKLDAALLQVINEKRRNKKYVFYECEYFLLTCDNTLYNVNKSFHRGVTIPEAINETQLTNMLFMCNSKFNTDAPTKLLISMFRNSSYLDYNVLKQFHTCLNNYTDKHPDQSQFLGDIFNNQNLFSILAYEEQAICQDDDSESVIVKLIQQSKENRLNYETETVESANFLRSENKDLKAKVEELAKAQYSLAQVKKDKINQTNQYPNLDWFISILLRVVFLLLIIIIFSVSNLKISDMYNGVFNSADLRYILIVFSIILFITQTTKNKIHILVEFVSNFKWKCGTKIPSVIFKLLGAIGLTIVSQGISDLFYYIIHNL